MKLSLGSIFKVSLRYVYKRGTTFYYQKKIPLDLVDRYGGKVLIKVNLKTTDLKQVAIQVAKLNKQYESTWASLRHNPNMSPQSVRDSAIKLLAQYGLQPQFPQHDESGLDAFIDTLQAKERAYTGGTGEGEEEHISHEEFLSSVELEALRLINEKPQLRLSDALEVYLSGHPKKNDEKFVTYVQRVWDKLMGLMGDKGVMEVTRADANEYVARVLTGGSKTGTVQRQINVIRAVFNVVIVERELGKTNPFLRLRIAGLGEDSKVRAGFDMPQLKTLIRACRDKDDDVRWLIGLQVDLGCRLGEVVGLALCDLHLEESTPYVAIRPHPWRTLKTKSSKRNIPLVGISLWAAQRIAWSAKKGQLYAFPRYTSETECKANNASATLNKWLQSLGIDKTTHELRHTMRDRLRHVNAPKPIQDAVGGWGREDVGDTYGLGYGLEHLRVWLDKAVLPIDSSLEHEG
ncbi:MAG: tyrosine-type recombinase/integrase [Nitrosospira sp.]|nr:tyrosine-type recombinase/integrase [Nitrosospira sp.]